jgi:hypothetical protein
VAIGCASDVLQNKTILGQVLELVRNAATDLMQVLPVQKVGVVGVDDSYVWGVCKINSPMY